MRKYISIINLVVICICLFFLLGCSNSSTESSNKSTSTISENKEGWHKKAGDTTGYDWIKMTDYQKKDIVKAMIDTVESPEDEITKDSKWIINNLNDFYDKDVQDTLDVNLSKAFSMVCVCGGAIKGQQEKCEKNMSKISTDEKAIWQYCMDRWKYYDNIEGGYSGDKHTKDVFNDASKEFGITASKAEEIWEKVNRASVGLD